MHTHSRQHTHKHKPIDECKAESFYCLRCESSAMLHWSVVWELMGWNCHMQHKSIRTYVRVEEIYYTKSYLAGAGSLLETMA